MKTKTPVKKSKNVRSLAAKKAWATMRNRGKNYASKLAKKAWATRLKNEKKAA
jgi:hypothetical protein